jgi:hypothetical protein
VFAVSPLAIVGMVVGILVVVAGINLAVWLPIVRRLHRMPDELRRELEAAGEPIVRGPERASYRGATAMYGTVAGIGIVALTEKRLLMRKAIGKPVEIARGDIVGVRTDKWFRRSRVGGREHVIVKTASGAEVGFFFVDEAAWVAALSPSSSAR